MDLAFFWTFVHPRLFAPEEEKEEVGSKVTDALGENFERHDKIAKIHQGVVNGGFQFLTSHATCSMKIYIANTSRYIQ